MVYYRVCGVDDLRDGEMKLFELAGYEYLVIRRGDQFYGLDNFCTHEGGTLSEGKLEGDDVVCPVHGGRFRIRTGDVTSPPPSFPLESYPMKIEGKDVLLDIKF